MLSSITEEQLTSEISIYGYPRSKYEIQSGDLKQVKQHGLTKKGYVLELQEEAGFMVHRISTEEGQSGAPVILKNKNGKLILIGIHNGSLKQQKC